MSLKYMRFHFNKMIMKKKRCNGLVAIVAMVLFCACNSDENAYYSDAAIESKLNTSAVDNSRLDSDIDFEVIPVGENNFVYLPKVTSAKIVTRSAEASQTYSATINGGVTSNQGAFTVTVSWDATTAWYRLSDGYSSTAAAFTYTINGSSIDVQLSFKVLCNGINIGDFSHSGILQG